MNAQRLLSRSGALACAGVLVATLALAGCTTARNTLGTDTSPCFRTLAVAYDAVNSKGHFAGVRYFSVSAFDGQLRRAHVRPHDLSPPSIHSRDGVCVVAYDGHYRAAEVKHGWAPSSGVGNLALVVVRLRDDYVLATIVLRHDPYRLTRVFPTR